MPGVTRAPAVPTVQQRPCEEAAGDREPEPLPRPAADAAPRAATATADPGMQLNQRSAVGGPLAPFALFYLIGWRGQRILPGEKRGVLEMI